jgi:hypothetical protein
MAKARRRRVAKLEAEFRRLAEECLKLAQQTEAPDQKLLLPDMAQAWLTLASNTEKLADGLSGRTDNSS